ncbi:MAG: response regulator [Candidatus Omnitrophica bacterium]|jgi:DNA-binding NtrC family response regulator|nr:response regulator [Candidatus Omnitrophota bacterium]
MKTILIVDDEGTMLDFIKRIIERRGVANVLTAQTPEEAVKVYQENKPLAAFIDLHLGDASGVDLLKNLKQIDPNIKAYFFTGDQTFANVNPPQSLGAIAYIIKPILPPELIKIIESL